jgi:hypothetical protein
MEDEKEKEEKSILRNNQIFGVVGFVGIVALFITVYFITTNLYDAVFPVGSTQSARADRTLPPLLVTITITVGIAGIVFAIYNKMNN